jgi:hypothetical protein
MSTIINPVIATLALPHHRLGALTVEQRTKVAADSKLSHNPAKILQALWMANPDCCLIYLVIYTIYNMASGWGNWLGILPFSVHRIVFE